MKAAAAARFDRGRERPEGRLARWSGRAGRRAEAGEPPPPSPLLLLPSPLR